MDVLVGSIDVRELLSTEDFEETSPLSAPDLRLLIDRLQIRSLQIKSKVRDYVLSHHDDFAGIFSRCAAAASGTEGTAAALAGAIRILSDRPVDGEIRDLAREIVSKKRELDDRREALAVVGTISTFLERLKVAREEVRAGRLVEAAVAVRDLNKGLRVSDVDDNRREEEEPAVFEFLRRDWLECFDENFIQFEPEKNTLSVMYSLKCGKADEIDLHGVLEALEAVPKDAAKMAEFENIIRCTSEFEKSLKEMKFLSSDNNQEERLSILLTMLRFILPLKERVKFWQRLGTYFFSSVLWEQVQTVVCSFMMLMKVLLDMLLTYFSILKGVLSQEHCVRSYNSCMKHLRMLVYHLHGWQKSYTMLLGMFYCCTKLLYQ